MSPVRTASWLRSTTLVVTTFALTASVVMGLSKADPGADYQHLLGAQSQPLFGFGAPLAASATAPSSSLPGNLAVDVAKGLKVTLVSDRVGENPDMIALWPNDTHPTHAIICNEIDGTGYGSPATVQRVELATGNVAPMVYGMRSCDPAHRTAWGTVIVGEENGATGRLWEILDPLHVNAVQVDRVAGTSSDPGHVVARTAVGQLSYEGVVLLPSGTLYYADELRPGTGKAGGGFYKFVPSSAWTGGAAISSLAQSPLAAGNVYAMRLGVRTSPVDYGQGSNVGAGQWVPLATPANPTTWNLDAAAKAAGMTGYYRPEDADLDPLAWSRGQVRICWNNTGNDAAENWGETLCLEERPGAGLPTGARPVVSTFVVGDPELRMPDNLDFQPGTGNLYILMDATTAAEGWSSNDDVWACLPDGADRDLLSDGCVRVMSLKDGEAEFSGIEFLADGRSFLIHLQHRSQQGRAIPGTSDLLLVSGLQVR